MFSPNEIPRASQSENVYLNLRENLRSLRTLNVLVELTKQQTPQIKSNKWTKPNGFVQLNDATPKSLYHDIEFI